MTEHSVPIKSSSSSSSGWSTDSPAMSARGILGGGADTASGRDNLSGLCEPVGYRGRVSEVLFHMVKSYISVFSFKLRRGDVCEGSVTEDLYKRLVVNCDV